MNHNKTMKVEVTNCHSCPFCNYDMEYGDIGCNAPTDKPINVDENGVIHTLPEDTVHYKCPLKTNQITVKLKR